MKPESIIALCSVPLVAACGRPGGADRANGAIASGNPLPRSSMPAPVVRQFAAQPSAVPAMDAPRDAQANNFDDDVVGAPPKGFSFGRTGNGPAGKWVVRADPSAPNGPNVLAQIDANDTDYRFPVAVLDAPEARDMRVSVRCKPVSGRVDRACGLVARYRDENDYYLTRANALEDNVRLYVVRGGQRHQLASWSGQVKSGAWHELSLELRGDHFTVTWNGQRVIEHRDAAITDTGRVGVWTKADSVTYFDGLRLEPLR